MSEQQVNMVKPVKAKKPFYKKWWVWLIAIVFVIAIAGGEEEVTPEVATEPAKVEANEATEPVTTEPEPVEEVVEEEVVEPEPVVEEPKEPEMTVSQESAIQKAESYISMGGFSKTGLITQLEFEGFSNEDSLFAVDNIEVDWKEQAVIKAESYMDMGGFSRVSLLEQMEFEGFTPEEATHGVDSVGL